MNDREDIEEALKAHKNNAKVRFHLRRFLGKKTKYEEVNGHIFTPSGEWCHASGCELSGRDIAENHDCPTPLEAIPPEDGF